MLIWEIFFNVFIKYTRYNKKDNLTIIILLVGYIIVWILCVINSEPSDLLIYVYTMGVAQGILSIFEISHIQKKYREKEWIKESFRENQCRIISFQWIEDLGDEELELLQKMNKRLAGKKGKNILIIAKDKKQETRLMFFIYKQYDYTGIQEICHEHFDIELRKENKRKQVIVCCLRS